MVQQFEALRCIPLKENRHKPAVSHLCQGLGARFQKRSLPSLKGMQEGIGKFRIRPAHKIGGSPACHILIRIFEQGGHDRTRLFGEEIF